MQDKEYEVLDYLKMRNDAYRMKLASGVNLIKPRQTPLTNRQDAPSNAAESADDFHVWVNPDVDNDDYKNTEEAKMYKRDMEIMAKEEKEYERIKAELDAQNAKIDAWNPPSDDKVDETMNGMDFLTRMSKKDEEARKKSRRV